MKFLNKIIILVVLFGCTKPLQSNDSNAISIVKDTWQNSSMPKVDYECLKTIKIERHNDYTEFKNQCKNPFSTKDDTRQLTGCTSSGFSPVPFKGREYKIHIAPKNNHELTTIQHETLHIIIICNDLHYNGDALHTDEKIWKKYGPNSLEQISNKKLNVF